MFPGSKQASRGFSEEESTRMSLLHLCIAIFFASLPISSKAYHGASMGKHLRIISSSANDQVNLLVHSRELFSNKLYLLF